MRYKDLVDHGIPLLVLLALVATSLDHVRLAGICILLGVLIVIGDILHKG